MPLLETAFVRLHCRFAPYCDKGNNGDCCGVCEDCSGYDDHNGGCMLLGGLSSARHLELIAPFSKVHASILYFIIISLVESLLCTNIQKIRSSHKEMQDLACNEKLLISLMKESFYSPW